MNKYWNDSEGYGSSDLRKFATQRIPLSQAKYLVGSLGSHKVKSFIPPCSLTLTGVMIPVGVNMFIFVHYYHSNSLKLSLFCLMSSLLFVHAANQQYKQIQIWNV